MRAAVGQEDIQNRFLDMAVHTIAGAAIALAAILKAMQAARIPARSSENHRKDIVMFKTSTLTAALIGLSTAAYADSNSGKTHEVRIACTDVASARDASDLLFKGITLDPDQQPTCTRIEPGTPYQVIGGDDDYDWHVVVTSPATGKKLLVWIHAFFFASDI